MTSAADLAALRRWPEGGLDRLNQFPQPPPLDGKGRAPAPAAAADPRLEPAIEIGSDGPKRLDPARAATAPAGLLVSDRREPMLLSQYRPGYSPTAWAMAVGVYIAVLLLLLPWTLAPAEGPPPIPVALVMEKPPAAPPPQPQPVEKQRPAPGRLSSDATGEVSPQKPEAATPPPSPPDTQVAAAPPKALLESQLPKPVAAPDIPALPEVEKPGPQYKEVPKEAPKLPVVVRLPPRNYVAPHSGRVPGPDATPDEYLAYLKALTRQHIGLLPPTAYGGHTGETVLAIVIRDDGTIGRIMIERSSGDPVLDEGVERMVRAAGRYPPLPQWIQKPTWEVTLTMRFPLAREN